MGTVSHVDASETPAARWRAFAVIACCSAVIVAVGAWLALASGEHPFVSRAYMDVTSDGGMLLAAIACAWRARRLAGRARVAWALVAAGAASWSVGGIVWSYHEVVLREPAPFPGVSDIGFLGLPLLASAGMIVLAGPWRGRAHVARRALDALIIAGSIALIEWTFALGPAWASRSGSPLEQATSLAYPVGDAALVTLVVALLPGAAAHRILPVSLLGSGLFALAFADSAWLGLLSAGLYVSGGITDVGWILAPYLIVLAAVCPVHRWQAPDAPLRASSRWTATAAAAPVLSAAAVVAWGYLLRGHVDAFVFWGALALVLAIVARQLVALLDNQALTQEISRNAAELERAYARIEEVNERRKLFVSAVAHELATPLTPIKLQLHRISSPKMGPLSPQQEHAIQVVRRNFDRLGALVQDLLDASRLEAGKLQLHRSAQDLDPLVHHAVASFRDLAAERGVELSVATAGPAPLWIDADRVSQVLFNLLGNAMRFTPAGGRVHVELVEEQGRWVTRVTDEGPGLAPEQIERLFQPFSQVHAQAGGTGLGLFISRGLVERHGGTIGCRSPGPGEGATFEFSLPVDAPEPSSPRGPEWARPAARRAHATEG